MAGGYYLPKGRKNYRVWIPWRGNKFFINKYLDGTSLYHSKQCERILERMRSEIDDGTFDPASWGKDRPLLLEKAWKTYQVGSPCGKARRDGRENIFKRYIQPWFHGQSIKLRKVEIDNWFTEIQKQSHKPSYLRVIVVTFKAFLRYFEYDLVKIPPFPSVSIPRKAIRWLSEVEQVKVHEFIPVQHLPIFHFLAITGCRPSEACNLRKSDIDYQKMIFTFRDTKTRQDNPLPITLSVEACFRAPRSVQHVQRVFCTASGHPYTRQILYGVWSRANRLANEEHGVPIVSNYVGNRHSKACNNIGELGLVSRLLGHSSIKTTERYYARYETEALGKVMDTTVAHSGESGCGPMK